MKPPERIEHNGYILIYKPDHPAAWKTSLKGYVYEHRVLVEAALGRFLRSDEHVHHKNQRRNDNRLDNLQVVSRQEHARIHRRLKPEREIKLICPQCGASFGGRSVERISHRMADRPPLTAPVAVLELPA